MASRLPVNAIEDFVFDGLAVGEHAHAGALRFFASGTLDEEPHGEAILRRYLESALLTAFATRRLLRAIQFSSVCPHARDLRPMGRRRRGGAPRRRAALDLERRLPQAPVHLQPRRHVSPHAADRAGRALAGRRLSPPQEQELMKYLESRREGLFDWIVFHRPTQQDPADDRDELGLDPDKKTIGLLTNVAWDAQLHYPANAFPNMLEWLVQTCEYFATRPDLQLLIRVHPAEISGFPPSRQPILGELRKRLPTLAPNIFVVPPESGVSTLYADVAVQCGHHLRHQDGGGADQHRPAGHRRRRSVDPEQGVDARRHDAGGVFPDPRPAAVSPSGLSGASVPRARRYAYHFFFNRMIPLPSSSRKRAIPSTASNSTALSSCCPANPKDWIQSATESWATPRSCLHGAPRLMPEPVAP